MSDSETERADLIVAQRARHRKVTAAIAVVLILSLGWNAWQQIAAQTRAQQAETSAVSLAEQVQHACESQGSLDLDGRDLCKQADEVVGDPSAPTVPLPGKDGDDATDAQVAAGVAAWFATHDLALTAGYSEAMQDAVAGYLSRNPPPSGKDGKPGKDAPPITDRQISDAVATYLIAHPPADGADGANGAAGRGVADTSLDGCYVVFTYTNGDTNRVGPICGRDGTNGTNGSDGRGIEKIECHSSGDWIIHYTDGTAGTTPGPCRALQPSPEPSPTATTTKGR